jgi:Trk K+ transport system NAD-binding subunit
MGAIKPSFAIVGCGKVGTVLCRELQNVGYVAAGLADVSAEALKKAAEQFHMRAIEVLGSM